MAKVKTKTQQLTLLQPVKLKKQHGGSLAIKKRRSKRPLSLKQSHHVTLKSHHAIGARCLFKHKKMILKLIKKHARNFRIKVYEYAIQGNHIHLLVKAKTRFELQNFFRVIAGHTAQRILKDHPLKPGPGGAPTNKQGCAKNQRKFWSYLIYSRVVTWGREFKTVIRYIQKNTLELLQIIAYEPRTLKKRLNTS